MQSQEISPSKRLAATKPREEFSEEDFDRERSSKNQTSKADTFERDTNEQFSQVQVIPTSGQQAVVRLAKDSKAISEKSRSGNQTNNLSFNQAPIDVQNQQIAESDEPDSYTVHKSGETIPSQILASNKPSEQNIRSSPKHELEHATNVTFDDDPKGQFSGNQVLMMHAQQEKHYLSEEENRSPELNKLPGGYFQAQDSYGEQQLDDIAYNIEKARE